MFLLDTFMVLVRLPTIFHYTRILPVVRISSQSKSKIKKTCTSPLCYFTYKRRKDTGKNIKNFL